MRWRRSRRRSACGCGATASRRSSGSCSTTAATAWARCPPRRWRSWRGNPPPPCCSAGGGRGGGVELTPVKTTWEPRLEAVPTREELAARLDDVSLTILDVRTDEEFRGKSGYPCDPRQGHIPGARHVHVQELFVGPVHPRSPEEVRTVVGEADEVVAYCHSGSRSALATLALRAAGYRARNYAGSWHEGD